MEGDVADRISALARSENMRRIRSKDTKPELRVRRIVYGLGYRYRLHAKTLPGHPDLVFAGRKKALFVHGCFWHQHKGCQDAHMPKSRLSYWGSKLRRNVERDLASARLLRDLGWKTLTVWACEIANEKAIKSRLKEFLK
jgi:DNA mismatch endonuclease, patch repair protein